MGFSLTRLFEPETNTQEVTRKLLQLLNVKVTDSSLKKEIQNHPEPFSLLCVSDTLKTFGIENLAIKITKEQVSKIPTPFVAQIFNKDRSIFFTVVKEVNLNKIDFYDPDAHIFKTVSSDEFLTIATGIALIVNPSINAGEIDYANSQRKEVTRKFSIAIAVFFIPAIALLGIFTALLKNGEAAIPQSLFVLFTLLGGIASGLLILYEINRHDPFFQKVCRSTSKINCNAILKSRGSKIFGTRWSVIGFSYFLGMLLMLLLEGGNRTTLIWCSWINLISLPYIIYSITYQWKIARQWCVLCLTVQAVLFVQFLIILLSIGYDLNSFNTITFSQISHIILCFFLPFIFSATVVPLMFTSKDRNQFKQELKKLKHDPEIFQALLQAQPMAFDPTGLGIKIGSKSGHFRLIKVCSPYCGPCGKAYKPIEDLIDSNENLQVQIIFFIPGGSNSPEALPAKHLLSVSESDIDGTLVRPALDDWFVPEVKDYKTFLDKYPVNNDLNGQDSLIEKMNQWCESMSVDFTPTFFLSMDNVDSGITTYHQLPDVYDVDDLKYLLSA